MKKILAILLAFFIMLCIAACGGGKATNAETENSNNQTLDATAQKVEFKATATTTNPTVMGTFYCNVAGDKISVGDDFYTFCIKYFATFSGNTVTVVE